MTAPAASGMRVDIGEIPDVVQRVVGDRAALADAAAAIRDAAPAWATIVARGSSDHAAIYLQYLLAVYFGLPAGLALPSASTIYGARIAWRGGLLIAISQSGESPDVRTLVEEAGARGALTLAITNRPDSPVAAAAQRVLDCQAGPERAIPATKTYVGCLAVAAGLVAELAPESDLAAGIAQLPDAMRAALHDSEAWLDAGPGQELVGGLADTDRALIVSRGFNLATALEVALKLKEGCGLFAAGYSSADVMHGPMVLALPDLPVIAFRPNGEIGSSVELATHAAELRGARPWLIGGAEVAGRPRALSLAPNLSESLTPLAYVVAGQLLTDRLAAKIGVDPDHPSGLAKVTRTL
jgi:glucosamine--fructose-6-phosphate aminotransferase (isomerizing)